MGTGLLYFVSHFFLRGKIDSGLVGYNSLLAPRYAGMLNDTVSNGKTGDTQGYLTASATGVYQSESVCGYNKWYLDSGYTTGIFPGKKFSNKFF